MPTIVGTTLFDGITFSDPNDVEAQLLNISATRVGVLEDSVRFNQQEQQARTQLINDLNGALAQLQQLRPATDVAQTSIDFGSVDAVNNLRDLFDRASGGAVPNPLDRFLTFPPPPASQTVASIKADGDFQKLLNGTRDLVDQASANSQLELIQLQALLNRRNQSVEFVTNLIARFSGLRDRIIGNIRS
jgi:hypothetical protein